MMHVFILNPAAGSGKGALALPGILDANKDSGIEYEIHRTISAGDARNFVKRRLELADGEKIRFYACGGDGTVNEVLNGVFGHDNAELAIVPTGTGNDFVRNFAHPKDFSDIKKQFDGQVKRIDSLRYEYYQNGEEIESGYALNMFNLGFDANVVSKTDEIKHGVLKGTAAYVGGVFSCLVKLETMNMKVTVDGEEFADGEFLLAGAANGGFSGGGFHGLPPAKVDDGLMDMLLVKSVTRRFFISIVKKYHDGTHMELKKLEGLFHHKQCRELIFRADSTITIAIDGETAQADELHVKIMPQTVNFVIPE